MSDYESAELRAASKPMPSGQWLLQIGIISAKDYDQSSARAGRGTGAEAIGLEI